MSLLISQQKVNIILKQNNIFCTVVSGLKLSERYQKTYFNLWSYNKEIPRGTWWNCLASGLSNSAPMLWNTSCRLWENAIPQQSFADSWKLACSELRTRLFSIECWTGAPTAALYLFCFFVFSLSLSISFRLSFLAVSLCYLYCSMRRTCTWILCTVQVYSHHRHHHQHKVMYNDNNIKENF